MRFWKQLFDFYLNSSVHVALAVYALSWITLRTFNILYDEHVLYFIFYATITGYNFVKYFGLARFHHRSLANWLRIIQVFSLICFILMSYYAFHLQPKTLLIAIGIGIVNFFYAIPFLPKNLFLDSNQNLRSISGLKIYVIAFSWAVVTVVLPLLNNSYPINFDVIMTGLQRFIFVLVLILPFDIRDLQYDSLKLATIPQRIGVKNTRVLGFILLTVFFFVEFLKDELLPDQILIQLIMVIVTMMFILFSSESRGKYYSAFWVEGLPVFWLLLLLLFG